MRQGTRFFGNVYALIYEINGEEINTEWRSGCVDRRIKPGSTNVMFTTGVGDKKTYAVIHLDFHAKNNESYILTHENETSTILFKVIQESNGKVISESREKKIIRSGSSYNPVFIPIPIYY